ncbi:MAG TPA: FKBP-type peptidyl-prolyl cis-trans isomerase, partial [Pedobacter sp.]
ASLKNSGLTSLNYDMLVKGLKDSFTGKQTMLTQEAAQKAIGDVFKKASQAKFSVNITEGKKFLENNKKNPGVQTTASGLQYIVLTPGSGLKPKATDTVLVNYKGTLLNGKQFDSSYDRHEPLSLSLDRVIPGWTEGMQLMPAGSKFRFFIPYNLAYGERGAGQDIPPYSTLIFEIELLKVNGK